GFCPATVPPSPYTTLCRSQGLDMLGTYAKFVLGFYGSMGVLWLLLFLAGAAVLGKRVIPLFREIRTPALLAFSTASSEAAYPRRSEEHTSELQSRENLVCR